MRICKNVDCGKEFEPNTGKQLFCSRKCAVYYHLRTEKAKRTRAEYRQSDHGKRKTWKRKSRYRQTKKGKQTEIAYRQSNKGKQSVKKRLARYVLKYPERRKAHDIARKIIRQECLIIGCGNLGERHHPDYLKPLKVIFLCRHHHRDLHTNAKFNAV
ncbi:hypothetical protein LCGC14_2395890 [marine sediment metagenome]|uniref:TRASH domain-containing protein n=1 Tax=marine sediment metagenome TaxID=412755 RepID=A0A0F9AA23_9ZZZZ